jgi:hypothetical protein
MPLNETVWLFIKDQASVRMKLLWEDAGPSRLVVCGPGSHVATYSAEDLHMGVKRRLQEALLIDGFRLYLQPSADRRSGCDRRSEPRGPDRRTQFRTR